MSRILGQQTNPSVMNNVTMWEGVFQIWVTSLMDDPFTLKSNIEIILFSLNVKFLHIEHVIIIKLKL